MKYNLIIGSILAYILLFLYGGIAIYIIQQVIACSNDPSCNTIVFHNGLVYVLTTVGGLVSALVVSNLTITQPGADPAMIVQFSDGTHNFARVIVWCYLLLWTVIGLASLIVGVLLYPDISKTLSDFGTTWLGIAVAAGYAYFGISPKK
jgi:hypothetical protein